MDLAEAPSNRGGGMIIHHPFPWHRSWDDPGEEAGPAVQANSILLLESSQRLTELSGPGLGPPPILPATLAPLLPLEPKRNAPAPGPLGWRSRCCPHPSICVMGVSVSQIPLVLAQKSPSQWGLPDHLMKLQCPLTPRPPFPAVLSLSPAFMLVSAFAPHN